MVLLLLALVLHPVEAKIFKQGSSAALVEELSIAKITDSQSMLEVLRSYAVRNQDSLKENSSNAENFKEENLMPQSAFIAHRRKVFRLALVVPSQNINYHVGFRNIAFTFDDAGKLLYIYTSLINPPLPPQHNLSAGAALEGVLGSENTKNAVQKFVAKIKGIFKRDKKTEHIAKLDAVNLVRRLNDDGSLDLELSGIKNGNQVLPIQIIASVDRSGKIKFKKLFSLSHKLMPNIFVMDANSNTADTMRGKGTPILTDGIDSRTGRQLYTPIPQRALNANQSLRTVSEYFSGTFGLKSWNSHGAAIKIIVNAPKNKFSSVAAWGGSPVSAFVFGDGGDRFTNAELAIDVIAHEYTHAIVESSAMLAASGQAGALNEHLADAFGEMVQNDLGLVKTNQELLIGESILSPQFFQLLVQKGFQRPALRNLLQPHQSYPPQPATAEEIPYRFRDQCQPDDDNDRCGTHSLSGVPNRAFALNVQSLGWDKLRKIYFDTMVTRLNHNSNFESFAESILEECEFSQMNAEDCASIRKNFETVEMIKPVL